MDKTRTIDALKRLFIRRTAPNTLLHMDRAMLYAAIGLPKPASRTAWRVRVMMNGWGAAALVALLGLAAALVLA